MLPFNTNPSARDLRGFARVWFPLFVIVVGAALRWRFGLPRAAVVAWVVGAGVAFAVLASRHVARVVFVSLLTLTYPMGLALSTLALVFLFYVVFTPLGWVMRRAGRDPLRLRRRGDATQWEPYRQDDDPRRALRQF